MRSDKGRAKIIGKFQRSKHTYEVFFMNITGRHLNANKDKDNNLVNDAIEEIGAGIFKDKIISGKPGVIRVLLMGNLSGINKKMPMTAWTLAHKIGHGFQDEMYRYGATGPIIDQTGKVINALNKIFSYYAGKRAPRTSGFTFKHFPEGDPSSVLTMRSARENNLETPEEVFPEIIAQYIITGKVTLRGSDTDVKLKMRQDALNHEIDKLLTMTEGHVIVEI